jgi:uncharacterized protein
LLNDSWEQLPPKAHLAYRLSSVLGLGGPATGFAVALGVGFRDAGAWVLPAIVVGWLLTLAAAFVRGGIQHRRTRYLLDGDGLRIRRGLCWRSETLVPRSRVQHMDLERGPVERGLGLASLVVHTAGTRTNAVRLAGVDASRARALRDALVDRAPGDDDAV